MSLELICILNRKEKNTPHNTLPISRVKVWDAIEREIELPSIEGGEELVLSNGSQLIRVRTYTRWTFADGDTTEFWFLGFQEQEDFVPQSMIEEFCTSYDVTEESVEVTLSYGKATLKAGDIVRDFALSDYMSALSSEQNYEKYENLTETQINAALERANWFKTRGNGCMNMMMMDESEMMFIHMAQGGDGSVAMMGNIREEYYKDKPDEFFCLVCDEMGWKF